MALATRRTPYTRRCTASVKVIVLHFTSLQARKWRRGEAVTREFPMTASHLGMRSCRRPALRCRLTPNRRAVARPSRRPCVDTISNFREQKCVSGCSTHAAQIINPGTNGWQQSDIAGLKEPRCWTVQPGGSDVSSHPQRPRHPQREQERRGFSKTAHDCKYTTQNTRRRRHESS